MPTPKQPYIERDESWMYFNYRLLKQAMRPDLPLLERFNYLGIYSNNLDEFFRVRIANLRRIAEYAPNIPDEERRRAREILVRVARLYREYSVKYEATLADLFTELDSEHIHIISERELTPSQSEEVWRYYQQHLSSAVNPIFLCSTAFIPERHLKESLYLAVCLRPAVVAKANDLPDMAIIEIPSKASSRFVRLKDIEGESYIILLDDVLRHCLPYIFAGLAYTDYQAYTFKLTKDSEIEIDQEIRRSVIDKVSQGLKRRKSGEPIRLVYDATMPEPVLERLCQLTDLDSNDTLLGGGRYHNMKDLMRLPDCGRPWLRYEPWSQIEASELQSSTSLLDRVLRKDIGIHFPYKSFDHFLRILREAAISPEVEEIRITLYRVAQDSRVVSALMAAAQNGKRVTAVVELLARFDEERNIGWSKKLQDAGVNVVFGHEKLKIHSKLVHIVTRKGGIACIGTGNLHEGNARLYTDYMLMTADKVIASDVLKVFEFIERPYLAVRFKSLLVAPNDMRRRLVALINREIRNAQQGKTAYIKLKLNHIVDDRMVAKLYEASEAGVKVSACVRGNCSVVPGVEGYSTRIELNGIIDRYLEHSRIYIFANGGNPLYYIGSADWMTRNLDKRIEVIAPVYDADIQKELEMIVDYGMRDTAQGYYVNEHRHQPKRKSLDAGELFHSQQALQNYYQTTNQQNIKHQ